jgi:ketosteroid isomerase-like protein
MPSRERVQELIAAVIAGDHAEVIARFYTDDASMQENAAEPRRGLAHLVERERKVTEKVARIVTHPPDAVVVDGDRVAIHWVFEFTHQDGRVRVIDEVALQVWDGDKIARERFFYDSPSAAWRAPGDPAIG